MNVFSIHARRSLGALGAFFLCTLLIFAGCNQSESAESAEVEDDGTPYQVGEPVSDSTVAIVVSSDFGTDTLSAAQYQQVLSFQMQRIPPNQRGEAQMQDIHRTLVQQYVSQIVTAGEADRRGVEPDSALVEAQFQRQRSQFETEQAFEEALTSSGLTRDSLRQYIVEQMKQQELLQQMAEEAGEPSEEELQEYQEENRRIRAQHILLRLEEDAEESTADSVLARAEALLDSLDSGADFTALAQRHSEGPSAPQGGDLGYFTKDRMVEPFAEAAFALSDSGDVAPEPVRTQFGYHLIRLTDSGAPMDSSRARSALMNEKRREAVTEGQERLMASATVRINPDVVQADLEDE